MSIRVSKESERVKRLSLIMMLLLAVLGAPAVSQDEPAKDEPKRVKTIVDYREELGLTQQQIDQVAEALKNFQETINSQRNAMVQYEKEYTELLKAHAPLPEIKQKLIQIEGARTKLRYADVVTSRKVESIMSEEQMTKWRGIQAEVRGANK